MLRLTFDRILPEHINRLRWWMAELERRRDEVLETFAQEGVRHEQAYLLETPDGAVLIYATEADDLDRARAAYAASTLPLDLEHRATMRALATERLQPELLYDVRQAK